MKKSILVIIVLLLGLISPAFSAKEKTINNQINNTNEAIVYDSEFRAVWISTLTSDISPYSTEAGFKSEMNTVFEVMEHFKLNAMIFHIRTHNNALYRSNLNPVAGWWRTVDFDKFDPLKWLIDECHKRGIEFHAWMNPYRLGNSHYYGEALPSENPASDPANTLGSILNPGLPNVRQFLIDTVMEVIENYDVDAIHFDDYFYTNLGANGELTGDKTILDEPDQATFIAYPDNFITTSAYAKAEWRRHQINKFIEGLSNEIKSFNARYDKHVQLGISPTGIYKNGNGVVTYDENGKPITNGSKTGGQTHFSSYLFADSVKWISEGWLDYILPQSYWATNHSAASYYEVMGWWDKVVKHLDINLYSGIGIYQADEANRFDWMTNPEELYKQLSYVESLENVSGVSFYSYKHLKGAYNGQTKMSATQLESIGKTIWLEEKLLPEIKSMESATVGKVNNFTAKGNKLSWDNLDNAKFYIIFKDETKIDFSNEQIYDVVGSKEDLVTYTDKESGDFVYGIKAMSYTNTVGEGVLPTVLPPDPLFKINFYVENTLIASYNSDDEFRLPTIPTKEGYDKEDPVWSITNFTNITSDINVYAIYKINTYVVNFYDLDDVLIDTQVVEYNKDASVPELEEKLGYIFKNWDTDITKVQTDLNVKAVYEKEKYTVKFYGFDGEYLKEEIVEFGNSATAPSMEEVSGYKFKEWDKDFSAVKENLVINAIFEVVEDTPEVKDPFSCKQLSYSFMVFALGFALFVFIKRKR